MIVDRSKSSKLKARLILAALLQISLALISSNELLAQSIEICENAIDDDGDGLIDLNDPDCACTIIAPESKIPNPSFEELNCCPEMRSELDCATGWIQASEATTDLINTCGWGGWPEHLPPQPFPDGNSVMGFRDGRNGNGPSGSNYQWKEYAGACLLSPLEAGKTYRFEFDVGFADVLHSPPINIAFFGTTDCRFLPFGIGNEAFGCPTNGPNWIQLGSVNVAGRGGSSWTKASIEITPAVEINAIAIGPGCAVVVYPVNSYYYFDNLLLDDIRSFDLQISQVNHPCSEDFTLSIADYEDLRYQWYFNGIALIGETEHLLSKNYGEGTYQVRVEEEGGSCRLSRAYQHLIPILRSVDRRSICKDEKYNFGSQEISSSGTYSEMFRSSDGCDSVVTLVAEVLELLKDTIQHTIFEGDIVEYNGLNLREEGEYEVALTSEIGCDSIVVVQLEFYDVFVPTAFSPNEDGVNDRFTLLAVEGEIQQFTMRIYDRWGNGLYIGESWDGSLAGKPADPGVYIYVIDIQLDGGGTKQLRGSFSLIR